MNRKKAIKAAEEYLNNKKELLIEMRVYDDRIVNHASNELSYYFEDLKKLVDWKGGFILVFKRKKYAYFPKKAFENEVDKEQWRKSFLALVNK